MGRRKTTFIDSLELLLDTMCNTFGAVMFIAIMLMVLASQLANSVDKISKPQDNEQEKTILIKQIKEIDEKINQLQNEKSLRERMISSYKNNPNLYLIEKLAAQKDLNNRLRQKEREGLLENKNLFFILADLNSKSKSNGAAVALISERIQMLKSNTAADFEKNKVEIEKLKEKIAQESSRDLSFSTAKTTTKSAFWLILDNKILYRISPVSREDFNSDITCSPDVRSICINKYKSYKFIPHKGIPLSSAADLKNIDSILSDINPSNYFLNFLVKDDSFESMILLIKHMRKKNYSFMWGCHINSGEYILGFTDKVEHKAY